MIEHPSEWHALVDSLVAGNVSEVSADNLVSVGEKLKAKEPPKVVPFLLPVDQRSLT